MTAVEEEKNIFTLILCLCKQSSGGELNLLDGGMSGMIIKAVCGMEVR